MLLYLFPVIFKIALAKCMQSSHIMRAKLSDKLSLDENCFLISLYTVTIATLVELGPGTWEPEPIHLS